MPNKDNNDISEEFLESKNQKKEKSIVNRIINIILWVVLFAWMGICFIDFYNVQKGNKPMFCIQKSTMEYSDGSVDSCLGLGYKIYNYNRDSFKGIEFGPFWSKDRTADND